MKALVLREYMKLVVEEVPKPSIGDDDVLVAVKACGICGSDVHGLDGSTGRRRPPVIMGHEAAGVIVETGRNVSTWKAGDRVTFDSTIYCGVCWFCRRGEINLCDNRRVLGVSCSDYRRDGAFAEYVAVPQRILYRLPDLLSFERAAMVEPLSIAVHAVGLARPLLGDTAVVVGAGMIGLFVVQVLRLAGCRRIVAVDIEPAKLELARRLGADAAVNGSKNDVAQIIAEQTDGRGADIAVEAVGAGAALNAAVGSLRKGGRLVLIGNTSPLVELPLQAVVTRQLAVLGSCASNGEYPACLDMIARGQVNVDALLSAVVSLEEAPAWFDRLYRKEPGLMKVVVKP